MTQRNTLIFITTLIAGLGVSNTALSETANEPNAPSFIITGPGYTTEFQGSNDYSIVPFIASQFNVGKMRVDIEGLGSRVTLYNTGQWQAGPALALDLGRNEEVENAQIAKLDAVDSAAFLGGFIQKGIDNVVVKGDELTVSTAVYHDVTDTGGGNYTQLSLSYAPPLMLPFRLDFSVDATVADDDYMQTYFGVDTQNSARSGLNAYQASAGLKDISLSTNIGLFVSPKWGAFARLSVTQLQGDAKDSPITKAGRAQSYFAGLGLYYRFGAE
ncbi:MAG: MipA/OmpV family protein [Pontibacterium sp.]